MAPPVAVDDSYLPGTDVDASNPTPEGEQSAGTIAGTIAGTTEDDQSEGDWGGARLQECVESFAVLFSGSAVGRSGSALLVSGSAGPEPGDVPVRDRLEQMGFLVTVKDDDLLTASDAAGMDLVLVSESVSSSASGSAIGSTIAAMAVPVMVWERHLFDELKMSEEKNWHTDPQDTFVVTDPSLTCGVSGEVTVASSGEHPMNRARPPASATVAAVREEGSDDAVWFGYGTGDALTDGSPAPAARVALWFSAQMPLHTNELGWKLFAHAVAFAIASPGNAVAADGESAGPGGDDTVAAPGTSAGDAPGPTTSPVTGSSAPSTSPSTTASESRGPSTTAPSSTGSPTTGAPPTTRAPGTTTGSPTTSAPPPATASPTTAPPTTPPPTTPPPTTVAPTTTTAPIVTEPTITAPIVTTSTTTTTEEKIKPPGGGPPPWAGGEGPKLKEPDSAEDDEEADDDLEVDDLEVDDVEVDDGG